MSGSSALKCAVNACGVVSSSFISCLGDCGKAIHSRCAGFSRTLLNNREAPRFLKYICEGCEDVLDTNTKILNINERLAGLEDMFGNSFNYVKRLHDRMDVRDEYISDLEKSLHNPDSVSATLSRKLKKLWIFFRKLTSLSCTFQIMEILRQMNLLSFLSP